MKVDIGPYVNWIGPYQVAEKILFWKDRDDPLVYKLGNFLACGEYSDSVDHNHETWFYKFCSWVHKFKKRKVKIRVDDYDIWSAEHTLGLIILPVLKKLKEVKHGSPFVDIMDVPEYLRPSAEDEQKSKEDPGYTDDKFHERWVWILDQMVWSFEQSLDEEADKKYYSNTGSIDWGGLKAFEAKKQAGFILFGKYFQHLWD